MSIKLLLNKILQDLENFNLPITKLLNKGIPDRIIRDELEALSLKASNDLIELYQWKNGVSINHQQRIGDYYLIPGYYFMQLQDNISVYNRLKNINYWNKAWFPFFSNGGGDYYAIDLSGHTEFQAPIIGYLSGDEFPPIEYTSLSNMLETFSECFDKGIIYKDIDGFLEMDDEKQALIAKKK